MKMKKYLVVLFSALMFITGCTNEAEVETTATPVVTPEPTQQPTEEPLIESLEVDGKIIEILDDGIAVIEINDSNGESKMIEVMLKGDVEFKVEQEVEVLYNSEAQKYEIKSYEDILEAVEPTIEPTAKPTAVPTAKPTAVPTAKPTAVPTVVPTAVTTAVPTAVPTAKPTAVPTAVPVACPGGYDVNTPCHELSPGNDPYSAGYDAVFPGDDWSQCEAWGQAELDKATAENSSVIRYMCTEVKNNGYGMWGTAGLLVHMQ